MTDADTLRKLEENVRAVGRQGREVERLATFELFIAPGALDHLSYAVPLSPDPNDWAPHTETLKEAFGKRGKRPRLEYFQELHPHLAPALEQAGFVCEMRAPVMTLDRAALPTAGFRAAGTYRRLRADDEPLLRHYLQRQSVAFGGADDETALDWLPSLRSGLQQGTVMGAALEREGKLLAGALIQIGAGAGELAGVWTDPQWRRQGLAYAVCLQLLAEYAEANDTLCWLSAAEGAQGLYEKLGFVSIGTQLNYTVSDI